MSYLAPLADLQFSLSVHVNFEELLQLPVYRDLDLPTLDAVISEAGKFAEGIWTEANAAGDGAGARLEGGKVVNDPMTVLAYRDFINAGWGALKAPSAFGGHNIPATVSAVCEEMWYGGNLSLSLLPLLTASAVSTIAAHASLPLQEKFLPPLINGTWTATMSISEDGAGSDLTLINTAATPAHDGIYSISGQKIFITWGEHELADNIIHLVLARLPLAPAGTAGISLFIVPKFWVGDDGKNGAKNGVELVSLEHKLGLHASPTCVLRFNEAKGYLVGEPHRGLSYMFTMMNHARLGVGIEGVALAEAAQQKAAAYARIRLQGRDAAADDSKPVAIIRHPDVKRMLLMQKAVIQGERALYLTAAYYLDLSLMHPDVKRRREAAGVVDYLIPLVKGFLSENSVVLTNLALQVFGGMGYAEETGIAQFTRDARITPIYEGTTGIQAQDSVGRKTAKDQGKIAYKLLDAAAESAKLLTKAGAGALAALLEDALQLARSAVLYVVKNSTREKQAAVAAGSVAYLMQMSTTLSAAFLVKDYLTAREALDNADKRHYPPDFYQDKLRIVEIFYKAVLPDIYAYYRRLTVAGDVIAAYPSTNI